MESQKEMELVGFIRRHQRGGLVPMRRRHEQSAQKGISIAVIIRAHNHDKTMNSARVNRRLVWCPRYELNVRPTV
jgi:hypothetical protein